jgi:hypothetical protein
VSYGLRGCVVIAATGATIRARAGRRWRAIIRRLRKNRNPQIFRLGVAKCPPTGDVATAARVGGWL